MPAEGDLKKRVGRKLTKRRKEEHQVTMDIPERFKDGDDADEDCTAPKGQNVYMNQSVFGMIAAAGSKVDFNARFEGQSSDDEEEEPVDPSSRDDVGPTDTILSKKRSDATTTNPEKHRRKFSGHNLLKSLPSLSKRHSKSKSTVVGQQTGPSVSGSVRDSSPQPESPSIALTRTTSRAPVMGQMLDAQAEMSSRPSFDSRRSSDIQQRLDSGETQASSLAKRLMEIFEFEKPEEVIEGKCSFFGSASRISTNPSQSTHAGS
jgi:sterol 3beta-glucosyltransferase